MVYVWIAFHENDGIHGNHDNDENDEDNSDSCKQGVECWINGNHRNHGNDENHGNPGCNPHVPQTTGLEIPEQNAQFWARGKKFMCLMSWERTQQTFSGQFWGQKRGAKWAVLGHKKFTLLFFPALSVLR